MLCMLCMFMYVLYVCSVMYVCYVCMLGMYVRYVCYVCMRKIRGFSIQRLLGKSLEISPIGPLFSQFDWWVPTWGQPLFYLGLKYIFPSRYSSFWYHKMFKVIRSRQNGLKIS